MASIYLIRHGQASFMQAEYDKLSGLGIKQSQLLGEYFDNRGVAFDYHLMGTLNRQIDTFKHFNPASGAQKESDGVWNEHEGPSVFKRHFPAYISQKPALAAAIQEKGIHEPAIKKELVKIFFKMHLDWAKGEMESGEHESWAAFKSRAEGAYDKMTLLSKDHERVGVFTSGGMIAFLVGKILGISDEKTVELNWQVKNTSVTEIQLTSGRAILREFNTTPHLRPEEITFV